MLARGLKSGRTHTIGLIESSIHNEIRQQQVVSFTNLLGEYGYRLYVSYSKGEPQLLYQACDDLLARGCDALIISGRLEAAGDVRNIADKAVFMTSSPPDSRLQRVFYYDHGAGVREAMEYLYGLGHRDIRMQGCYWTGFMEDSRPVSFQKSLREFGLDLQDPISIVDAIEECSPEYMRGFFEQHPDCTAILCSNDLLAMRIIQSCCKIGLSVPGNVSVIGFDDIRPSSYYTPALTSIRQPFMEGTQEVSKMLMNMLEDRNECVCPGLPSRLVVRESTGPARDKALKLK